ncbi:MAG: hypothetical protein EOO03_01480 [Chitinophagaceae bacterium]|nr:MAG: hypothetical protein EOO03_01480 [Chitinophagaceae bacterium]
MKHLFFICLLIISMTASAQVPKDSINPVLVSNENRELVFDDIDLKIIERADTILSDSSKWHKNDDRVCEDDLANGRYSLFCALYKASIDITGEYAHRRAALQQVRFVLEKYENGRVKEHRLMDWNNHPDTKFEEVKKVIRESIEIIKRRQTATSPAFEAKADLLREQLALQQTVINFFDALSKRNAAEIKKYTAADIILYENGAIWNIDSLILKAITLNTDPSFKRSNRFDFIHTNIYGNTGWVSYNLVSAFSTSNKKRTMHWMETVVAVKEKNEWKIKTLHSTVIKRVE